VPASSNLESLAMRVLAVVLAASLIAAGAMGEASAAAKKKRLHKPGASYPAAAPAASRRDGDYYENVLEKVPFGSQRWWEVYGRQHGSPMG
jgi:hypothetical protein